MEINLSPTIIRVDLGEGTKSMLVSSKFKTALAA
jgi:hypothetical protein